MGARAKERASRETGREHPAQGRGDDSLQIIRNCQHLMPVVDYNLFGQDKVHAYMSSLLQL